MQKVIEQYQLAWHPQMGPAYRIKLVNTSWGNWVKVPAAEFSAIALILNESPVYYNTQTHAISTGEEPTGN